MKACSLEMCQSEFRSSGGLWLSVCRAWCREGASKKGAYIPPAGEEGENHNLEMSAAFEQLADHFAKKGAFHLPLFPIKTNASHACCVRLLEFYVRRPSCTVQSTVLALSL